MTDISPPFDAKLILGYIGVSFSPILLCTQMAVVFSLPFLSSFKKPRKLIFYLLYVVPEFISFCLLFIYYIVPVSHNIASRNKLPVFDNPAINIKVVIGVLYYYVMAYTVELLFNYQDMQIMLMLHHGSAIAITVVASYLALSLANDLLLMEYIIFSGTSAVLHASIDFVPHIYLLMRQFKANKALTRFFGNLSIWPLTLFRLCANVFFIIIVRYFVMDVLQERTSIFYGWTAFMASGTAILAITQYWAHGVYVKIQMKDRERELEPEPGSENGTICEEGVNASETDVGTKDEFLKSE
ncbi:hypothetical protein HDU79_004321 [Rhizoclosmatium sp. JEL0117]|nr:hypothetical protein HDU79_004321 [Rhizoclosmatium sp. JEL0117]